MIELYLSKVTETTESEQAGKFYARVSYKQTLSVQDMAHHIAKSEFSPHSYKNNSNCNLRNGKIKLITFDRV